jgi:hypothetical protein
MVGCAVPDDREGTEVLRQIGPELTDRLFIYECDRCGDQFLVGRAGVGGPDQDWGEGGPCGRDTESGERCVGRFHLVEQRFIGSAKDRGRSKHQGAAARP